MGRLFLLRHAKAAWAQPGMRDFDRPLEASGRTDAETLGARMADRGYAPDRVLCSTALRARETWGGVSRHLGLPDRQAQFEDGLYSSDATGYLSFIRKAGEAGSLLLIGHNPMMEDLAGALAGEAGAMASFAGFPTCGLAVIEFPGNLATAAPGEGRLEAFMTPAQF